MGTRRRVAAQAKLEFRLLLRNGENLLVTLGLPIGVLVFFSLIPVLPTGDRTAVAFLVPGVLTLSVMASAMVSVGIATGFEREYLVLKRLGATPLRRSELILAKALAVLAVQAGQIACVVLIGLALGWRPHTGAAGLAAAGLGVLLASLAFAGIGLALAGRLPALGALAAVNGVFLALLLISGIAFPLEDLPGAMRTLAYAFPPAWLARLLRAALEGAPLQAMLPALGVLTGWAAAATTVAARVFRWE